jgi:hypothetical protein
MFIGGRGGLGSWGRISNGTKGMEALLKSQALSEECHGQLIVLFTYLITVIFNSQWYVMFRNLTLAIFIQCLQIQSAPRSVQKETVVSMDLEPSSLANPTSDADSLISTNDPDTMANEQTWPTDDEMRGADTGGLSTATETSLPDANMGTTPKSLRKVPKGTSQYQAAWIVEEEDEGEDEDEDEDGSDANSDDSGSEIEETEEIDMEGPSMPQGEEQADLGSDRKSTVAFMDLDADEENKQCVFCFPMLSLQVN